MPYLSQVAVGTLPELTVFGSDFKTKDGFALRDYIHIQDLAQGFVSSLLKLKENPGFKIYNLGSGTAYSVLEMIKAFEKASERKIKFKVVERKPGDLDVFYSDVTLAKEEIGFVATRGLHEMCRDLWNWQVNNPKGFSS